MNRLRYILAILLTIGQSPRGLAESVTGRGGDPLREQCRSLLAGHYLNLLNERDRQSEYLRLLGDQQKEMGNGLAKAKLKAAALEERVRKEEYDVNLARSRDGAQFLVLTLERQIAEQGRLLATTAKRLEELSQEERLMKRSLEPVFIFKKSGDNVGGGYGFQLDWRTSCPKYRYICTLPIAEAKALLDVKIEGRPPESCLRYHNLSMIDY